MNRCTAFKQRPRVFSHALLLYFVLLLKFSVSLAEYSLGTNQESAYVGKPTQTFSPKHPKHKLKLDLRLVHLRFSYFELMDVLCPGSADGTKSIASEDDRRKLCSFTCGSNVPKFVANLAMDILDNSSVTDVDTQSSVEELSFPLSPASPSAPSRAGPSTHHLEVTLSRGHWNVDQWGSAATLCVQPIGHGQSGVGAGSGRRWLGLHAPAGATILMNSFLEPNGTSRGISNGPAFSQSESKMHAIHAKLSPVLLTRLTSAPSVEAAAGQASDGSTAAGPFSARQRPLQRVRRSSGIDAKQTVSANVHASAATGDERWFAVHDPTVSLTGSCIGSWMRELLPASMHGPPSSRQKASSSAPLTAGLEGGADVDEKKWSARAPTSQHAAPTLASMLQKGEVGQAVSLAPWGSLRLHLSVHPDNNVTSTNLAARRREQAYRVQVEVTLSLMLLPTRVKSHKDFIEAMQFHENIHNASEILSCRESPVESGGALLEKPAQATNVTPRAPSAAAPLPASAQPCDDPCSACPVARMHRTVRNLQTGYIMTEVVLEVGGCDTDTSASSPEKNDEKGSAGSASAHTQCNVVASNREILVTVTEPVPSFVLPLLHTYRLSQVTLAAADAQALPGETRGLLPVADHMQAPSDDDSEAVLIASLPSFAASSNSVSWAQALKVNTSYSIRMLQKVLPQARERHPADASRGRDYPPAYVSLRAHGHGCGCSCSLSSAAGPGPADDVLLMTPSNLVRAPIPDASMPFNVLTLGATAMAFLLGSLTNALFDPA